MLGWLKKKATQLQKKNTKRDLDLLIDEIENSKSIKGELQLRVEVVNALCVQLVKSMRGPLPKRDLVAELFDPILKNKKKYKLDTILHVKACMDKYQDSHPK